MGICRRWQLVGWCGTEANLQGSKGCWRQAGLQEVVRRVQISQDGAHRGRQWWGVFPRRRSGGVVRSYDFSWYADRCESERGDQAGAVAAGVAGDYYWARWGFGDGGDSLGEAVGVVVDEGAVLDE